MNSSFVQQVIDVITRRSSIQLSVEKFSFADALSYFIDYSFTDEEAENHWKNIIERMEKTEAKLNRRISIYAAVVDYFTSEERVFNSPVLVEIKVLRQTEQFAMMDGLTNVFNRRYMDLYLRKEINRCNRYNKCFSVMLLDVDDFKKINDTHGHVNGDVVLQAIARVLKETIREEDVLCRYGGEEFLIIMPETDADNAIALYPRIQEKLQESEIYSKYKVTLSAGCANFTAHADNLIDLLRCADISLYKAKKAGKNRAVKYEKE